MSPSGRPDVRPFVFLPPVIIAQKLNSKPLDNQTTFNVAVLVVVVINVKQATPEPAKPTKKH
jgi:hypothetical protein